MYRRRVQYVGSSIGTHSGGRRGGGANGGSSAAAALLSGRGARHAQNSTGAAGSAGGVTHGVPETGKAACEVWAAQARPQRRCKRWSRRAGGARPSAVATRQRRRRGTNHRPRWGPQRGRAAARAAAVTTRGQRRRWRRQRAAAARMAVRTEAAVAWSCGHIASQISVSGEGAGAGPTREGEGARTQHAVVASLAWFSCMQHSHGSAQGPGMPATGQGRGARDASAHPLVQGEAAAWAGRTRCSPAQRRERRSRPRALLERLDRFLNRSWPSESMTKAVCMCTLRVW